MVECERVAGGRPMMQDHLLVMVLAETLTSAESTALTFDFTHTHSTTCTDIIIMLSASHFVCFCNNSYSFLIAVEPPNNSHKSLASVQWLHFRFLWRDSNPVENL